MAISCHIIHMYSLNKKVWNIDELLYKKKQYLIGIDAKLHTDDNILIGNGWSDLNKWLAPGEAVPFKVTIIINSKDLIDKYIKDGDYKLKTDFYPWSDTCNY